MQFWLSRIINAKTAQELIEALDAAVFSRFRDKLLRDELPIDPSQVKDLQACKQKLKIAVQNDLKYEEIEEEDAKNLLDIYEKILQHDEILKKQHNVEHENNNPEESWELKSQQQNYNSPDDNNAILRFVLNLIKEFVVERFPHLEKTVIDHAQNQAKESKKEKLKPQNKDKTLEKLARESSKVKFKGATSVPIPTTNQNAKKVSPRQFSKSMSNSEISSNRSNSNNNNFTEKGESEEKKPKDPMQDQGEVPVRVQNNEIQVVAENVINVRLEMKNLIMQEIDHLGIFLLNELNVLWDKIITKSDTLKIKNKKELNNLVSKSDVSLNQEELKLKRLYEAFELLKQDRQVLIDQKKNLNEHNKINIGNLERSQQNFENKIKPIIRSLKNENKITDFFQKLLDKLRSWGFSPLGQRSNQPILSSRGTLKHVIATHATMFSGTIQRINQIQEAEPSPKKGNGKG